MQETYPTGVRKKGPLERGMVTHSSVLAWRIPWTKGPGGLQSIGSHGVRHGGSDSAYACLQYTIHVGFCSLLLRFPLYCQIFSPRGTHTRFIHLNNCELSILLHSSLFIHFPVDGPLGCFCRFAVTNDAA